MMSSIENWRIEIDKIEDDLIKIINRRAKYACEIGAIKRTQDLPIFDPKREDEILERIAQKNPGPLPNEDLQKIFRTLIETTREFEARHSAKA